MPYAPELLNHIRDRICEITYLGMLFTNESFMCLSVVA